MSYEYVIDAYAWIEYFRGSKLGEVAKHYIEEENSATPTVVIAELSRKLLKEVERGVETIEGRRAKLEFIGNITEIVALVVETNLRSTRYGTRLILEFFEKGTGFSVVIGERVHPIESLNIRYGLIEIHHANEVFKAPLNPKELNYGKIELDRPIDLSDLEYGTSLVMPLRERFRYEDVEELRRNLEAGKEMLRLYWDNGKVTYCAKEILGIKIPGGTKKIVEIERAKITEVEKWIFDIIETTEREKLRNFVGQVGEMIVKAQLADYVLNEARRALNIGEEVPLKLLSVKFDKDEYDKALKKSDIERRAS